MDGPVLLYRPETLWDSGGINNNKKGGCVIQRVIGKEELGRVGEKWFGVDMIKIHCLNLYRTLKESIEKYFKNWVVGFRYKSAQLQNV